ncbi:MAG TPA: hypothetical protein VFV99_00135 [Kofleriaceae bacterium]|nr:hypothetical protein [Kofleriaceae bacterium]
MRRAGLLLLALTGCANIFGLDSPQMRDDGGAGSDTGSDGPPVSDCHSDNFDDNALNPGLWAKFVEKMETVTETNQQLAITLDNTTGSAYSGIDGVLPLAADETGVQVEVVQWSGNDQSETALVLVLNGPNQLIIGKDGNSLRQTVKTGGADMTHMSPFDASIRFLRIERRLSDTKVTFLSSTDGTAWNLLFMTNASFADQALKPQLYAGHYQQVPATTVIFDNFVVLSPRCP